MDEVSRRDPMDQLVGQISSSRNGAVRVLGIVGCRSGDGTTFVTQSLSAALAMNTEEDVVEINCSRSLVGAFDTHAAVLEACSKGSSSNLWRFDPPRLGVVKQQAAFAALGRIVEVLSTRFRFLVLDCGAVGVSGMLWPVARVVDDLLLVVAAGETTKSQIVYAQRLIERSGAHLAGCILNKRTYPLPKRLYRLLA